MSISKPDAQLDADIAEKAQLTRRRRTSVGGFGMQLDAPQRAGWTRRWVNADPLRVQRMTELGYAMVSTPAAEGTTRTDGMGTRISRMAGKDDNGQAYQTILMETPNELYAEGTVEKEQSRDAFEEAIRRGKRDENTPDGAYIPSPSQISRSG